MTSAPGIKASANLRVELSNLSASGAVRFKIEGDNRTPIQIQANVVPDDLTNLVTAINDQSGRTGVSAALSTNKKRVILEKADGKDIFISEYMSTSPQLTAKPVDRKGKRLHPLFLDPMAQRLTMRGFLDCWSWTQQQL